MGASTISGRLAAAWSRSPRRGLRSKRRSWNDERAEEKRPCPWGRPGRRSVRLPLPRAPSKRGRPPPGRSPDPRSKLGRSPLGRSEPGRSPPKRSAPERSKRGRSPPPRRAPSKRRSGRPRSRSPKRSERSPRSGRRPKDGRSPRSPRSPPSPPRSGRHSPRGANGRREPPRASGRAGRPGREPAAPEPWPWSLRRSKRGLMRQRAKGLSGRRSRGVPAAGQGGWGLEERASPPLSQTPSPGHKCRPLLCGVHGRHGCGLSVPALAPPASVGHRAPAQPGLLLGHRRALRPPPLGAKHRCGRVGGSGAGGDATPTRHHPARPAAADRDRP